MSETVYRNKITFLILHEVVVKDEKGDLFADSHILNKWKNYFPQLLQMHTRSFRDVRQVEIHMAKLM
jgi:hypothetical protein